MRPRSLPSSILSSFLHFFPTLLLSPSFLSYSLFPSLCIPSHYFPHTFLPSFSVVSLSFLFHSLLNSFSSPFTYSPVPIFLPHSYLSLFLPSSFPSFPSFFLIKSCAYYGLRGKLSRLSLSHSLTLSFTLLQVYLFIYLFMNLYICLPNY